MAVSRLLIQIVRRLITTCSLVAIFLAPDVTRADVPTVTIDPKTSSSALSASIPVSGSFVAKYVFDAEVKDASLDVWPANLSGCNSGVSPTSGSLQTYHLPLAIKTDGGKSEGTALVPHLQVAERFCFQVSSTQIITPAAVAIDAAIADSQQFIRTMDEASQLAQKLLQAAARDVCSLPDQAAPHHGDCAPIDVTGLRYPLLAAVLQAATIRAEADSLLEAQAKFDEEVSQLKSQVLSFHPPSNLEAEIPSETWLKGGLAPDHIAKATSAVEKNKAKIKNAKEILDWLVKIANAQSRLTEANSLFTKAAAAAEAETAAAFARQRDVAVEFFHKNLQEEVRGAPVAVEVQTNDFHNYLSPEMGIAVAHPFVKDAEFSIIPYVAVNFYARPVDRELPLGQLLHSTWQRLSLALGLSLTQSLKAQHVSFHPTVANGFGIIGVGYRVLPFAKIAALLLFAEAKPTGGLSAQSKIVTAGALSLSADLDVVAFLSSTLKN